MSNELGPPIAALAVAALSWAYALRITRHRDRTAFPDVVELPLRGRID